MNQLDWTDVLVAIGLYPEESDFFSYREFDGNCAHIMDDLCNEVLQKLADDVQLSELQNRFLDESKRFVERLYLGDVQNVGHLWKGLFMLKDLEFMFYFQKLYKWMWN